MFPSSNNGNDPIFYSDQPAYSRPFFNDITTTLNSKQEEPPPPPPPPPPSPLSIFHLPSPFYPIFDPLGLDDDYNSFLYQNHDLLLHQQQQQQQQQQEVPLLRESSTSVSDTTLNMVESSKHNVSELTKVCSPKNSNGRTTTTNTTKTGRQIPIRKRASKRDRHSKINTAQGPRDRRMRLSLKVARDFFDLQDRLGFDKASKTVEWLLSKARPEIKKLPDGGSGLSQANNYSCSFGAKSASSTSECEVVSAGIDVEDQGPIKGNSTSVLKRTRASPCVKREKKARTLRKTAFNPVTRESRDKKRARARERTKEKKRSRGIGESKPCTEAKSHELSHLSAWSPFETVEESATQTQQSQNMNASLEALAEVEAPTSNHEQEQLDNNTSALIDNSLVVMGKWSPSAIFCQQHNSTVPQEHQFTDYQSLCKPWDAYNDIL